MHFDCPWSNGVWLLNLIRSPHWWITFGNPSSTAPVSLRCHCPLRSTYVHNESAGEKRLQAASAKLWVLADTSHHGARRDFWQIACRRISEMYSQAPEPRLTYWTGRKKWHRRLTITAFWELHSWLLRMTIASKWIKDVQLEKTIVRQKRYLSAILLDMQKRNYFLRRILLTVRVRHAERICQYVNKTTHSPNWTYITEPAQ